MTGAIFDKDELEIKTSDLALASVMRIRGNVLSHLERQEGDKFAYFVFRFASEEEYGRAIALVSEVQERLARVEPIQFIRELKRTREQVYDFMT